MVHRPTLDQRSCFVLLPLSQPFLGYFDKIICPAAAEVGLIAEKADDVYGTRPVINDIWDQIWKAKIAIAIVSGKNPNVNYELGMCHTLGIPTILLAEKPQDVPFDYRHRRYIPYKTKNAGWEQKLREDIVKTMKAILAGEPNAHEALPWPYDIEKLLKTSIIDSPVDDAVSRQLVSKGVGIAIAVVSAAFGPDGIGISQKPKFGPAILARSGVKVLRSIESGNPFQMQGIEALYEVAQDMQQREGDLTKTAVIMAGSMMAGGERLTASGIPIRPLLAGMQQASDAAATYLLGLATPVNPITMRQVALSACSNPRIAEAIASAVEKVGSDGVVDVMEAGEEEVQLEFQEGFQFDQGYLSPRFINNPETAECVLENVRVLVFEPRIASMAQLLPILEEIARSGESLLIISSDVEGEALSTLTVNVEKGTLRCVAVRSPGFGDRRRSILEDIAVVTGSRAFLQEDGIPLSSVRLSHLGKALRATVSLGSTSIVGAGGNPQSIATRVDSLRAQAASSPNSFDQAKLRERLARLVSGSATVRIGGHTESERSERIYGAHAALNACSTSMERGVVAGGGAALLRARLFARRIVFKDLYEGEGIQLVLNALMEPINVIMQNAKVRDPAEKLGTIVEAEVDTLTFDSESGRVADCRETGVMDSARSLSMAVTLACSHAKTHLRTGAWTQPSSGS